MLLCRAGFYQCLSRCLCQWCQPHTDNSDDDIFLRIIGGHSASSVVAFDKLIRTSASATVDWRKFGVNEYVNVNIDYKDYIK